MASDEALLQAASEGDGEAFAAFYRRHRDLVLAYLHRRLRDPELAFDLAAETFAAALIGLARFDPGRGPAVPWLLGIAHNKLLESLRRGRIEAAARRRLHHEPIAVDDQDLLVIEERLDFGTAALERLLIELPGEQRDAIRARVLDERDYADIAADLRTSPQVVRQRVSRGLRTLRTRMGDRS
jgi:RNA polymerase sigma factor (sigma-70 family)